MLLKISIGEERTSWPEVMARSPIILPLSGFIYKTGRCVYVMAGGWMHTCKVISFFPPIGHLLGVKNKGVFGKHSWSIKTIEFYVALFTFYPAQI